MGARFLVEADLVLNDRATRRLREIGAMFEKIGRLEKEFGKSFSTLGVGRAAKDMELLSRTAAIAAKSSRELGETLRTVRLNSGAASGVQTLAGDLKAARSEASALSKLLSTLRAPPRGTGGSVPPSGRPPAIGSGGHAPRGGHASMWELARRGFYAVNDIEMMASMAGTVLEPSVEYGHQRFLARQMLGTSPGAAANLGLMNQAAYRVARQVPNMSAASVMALERELYPIMMSMSHGGDPMPELMHWLPEAAKWNAVLANSMGENAGTTGERASQFYSAIRAGEQLGFNTSPERLNSFITGAMRAVIASGGKMGANAFTQFASTAGSAAYMMDPDFITHYLPELFMAMGSGSKVGTMAQTFQRSTFGRGTVASMEFATKLGLLDPHKWRSEHGHVKIEAGAWKDELLKMNEPLKWVVKDLLPALSNLGIDWGKAKAGDINERAKAMRALNMAFSDRKAVQFVEELLAQYPNMVRTSEMVNQVGTDYDRSDPKQALQAFRQQLDSLASTIGLVTDNLGVVNLATDALSWIAEKRAAHPSIARATEIGGIGGIGLAGGWAAYRLLTAGPALTGAAGRLSLAAGQLSAAAGRLTGSTITGGPAKAAAGAGAGAAVSKASRVLRRFGAFGAALGTAGAGFLAYDYLNSIDWEKFNKIEPQLRKKGWSSQKIGQAEMWQTISDYVRALVGLDPELTPELAEALPGYKAPLNLDAHNRTMPPFIRRAGTMAGEIPGFVPTPAERKALGLDLHTMPVARTAAHEAEGASYALGTVGGVHGGMAGGEGHNPAGAGAVAGALAGAVAALQAAAAAIQATASRAVQLQGTATLTGNVNINMGQLGSQIAALAAKGVAQALSGGGKAAGGARPDYSGGSVKPSPN